MHDLLRTADAQPGSGSIDATWYNGRRGRDPRASFRSHSATRRPLPLRLTDTTEAERHVRTAAEDVLETLRGVFHLDPVPHLMRQYVPSRDTKLRRTAENLPAVIGHMAEHDPQRFQQLVTRVQNLVEHEVTGIEVIRSELNDVMLALREDGGRHPGQRDERWPARDSRPSPRACSVKDRISISACAARKATEDPRLW